MPLLCQKHNEPCTEAFARESIMALTKALGPGQDAKADTEHAIARVKEADETAAAALPSADASVPDEAVVWMAEAVARGNIDDVDVPQPIMQALETAASRGRLDSAFGQWQPWWTRAGVEEAEPQAGAPPPLSKNYRPTETMSRQLKPCRPMPGLSAPCSHPWGGLPPPLCGPTPCCVFLP